MFISSALLCFGWDHMKNLDVGLRIPFYVPLVPMLDRGVEARWL